MTQLSQHQIETFHRDGCITIENAVSTAQLEGMRAAFDRWVDDSRAHQKPYGEQADGRPRFDLEPGHTAERPGLRRVASPTELDGVFLDVLTRSAMITMLQDLIGPDLRLHHSKLNSKLPGTATTVKWHQDFTYDPHSNDDVVTCLVFLDDVTEANGPLRIVPGSHKGPLYSLRQNGRFTGAIADEFTADLDSRAIPQMGKAGSACLMHSRVLHASSANASDQPRTLFIAEIAAADAMPLTPNPLPSRHAGLLLAGSEPGRIRATSFEMEMPEIPTGASFFDQQASTSQDATAQ
jgi:ectoine hydroxylase-related dioxygenase (phytanoyl-CoA dioxygenase family)